jgi:hypothetical protein
VINWDSLVLGPTMAVFGQPVLYQPMAPQYTGGPLVPHGAPLTITAVFDENYRKLDPLATGDLIGRSSYVTSARPVLGVRLSLLPVRPTQGDRLTIVLTAQVFAVGEVEPDRHGHALLLLNDA